MSNRLRNSCSAVIIWLLSICCQAACAQNVNIEDWTNLKQRKIIKFNGGVSANSTYFTSNEMSGRDPWTYQLSGNLNVSILEQIQIPLSFSFNNYGAQYTYPSPPNRLSLHPSYKWARAHLGDVAMVFSPYTLNGHLFTGAGVELTPGRWAVSAMGGLLLRKTNYNPEIPNIMPSYDRWGYGTKLRYNGETFFVGANFFGAHDNASQISFVADSLGIFPKRNIALGIEAGVNIRPNLKLAAEYATSILTRDMRAPIAGSNFLDKFMDWRTSTDYYYAIKASLDYTFTQNTIGLSYERISPGYETLGAYYFNNDYQNITVNYARPLFAEKATIAVSAGIQNDDLNKKNETKNTRIVGSLNFAYTPIENLNINVNASTFQGFRVVKSSFDYINQTTPYENLDTLNFTQLSTNIDANIRWTISRNESIGHMLMFSSSYQEAADKQGDYILPGNLNRFFNGFAGYTLELISINMIVNAGFNVSNNYSSMLNFLTIGPTLSVSSALLQRALTTGITLSYNYTQEEQTPLADVFNLRWNAGYKFLKKHTIQANLVFQQRNRRKIAVDALNVYSMTASLNYFFNF